MKLIDVQINEATPEQLFAFATLTLGLEPPPNAGTAKLRSMIQAAAYDKPTIRVPGGDGGGAKAPRIARPRGGPMRVLGDGQDPEEKIWIRIPATKEPGGDLPVPVGVNGIVMLIPRDEDSAVPRKYVQVLLDAIEWQYDPEIDSNGKIIGVKSKPREVKAYQVDLIGQYN